MMSKGTKSGVLTYLYAGEMDSLACLLSSYFEDLISGTNIWNSFVSLHQRSYEKPIPFYDTADYYEGEINLQDISFLLWYFLNLVQHDMHILPTEDRILQTAEEVMKVFEGEWETAPENEELKTYYLLDNPGDDFYKIRDLVHRVLFKTYLFFHDSGLKLYHDSLGIMEKYDKSENTPMMLYENEIHRLHDVPTLLLGIRGDEWVAEILGKNQGVDLAVIRMTKRLSGFFFYQGQDDDHYKLEHIATETKFDLMKASFPEDVIWDEEESIVYLSIVKWQGDWWSSGIFTPRKYNQKLVDKEKGSAQSQAALHVLKEENNPEINLALASHDEKFKRFNHGERIAFMKEEETEAYVDRFLESFNNNSPGLPEGVVDEEVTDSNEAKNSSTKDAEDETANDNPGGVVFFNPNSGPEIAIGINSAFPNAKNPFFNQKESEIDVVELLFEESFSPELVHYCIDTHQSELPFFGTDSGKVLLDNLDFLLRFTKGLNYFTTPTISLADLKIEE